MKNLIYYPGFDVKDENWLKFALLYIDELNPIIPVDGDAHTSSMTKHIQKTTDLIVPYRPEYDEGEVAANKALDLFEKLLRRPERYIPNYKYHSNIRKEVFLSGFTDKRNQNYVLFNEKYSYVFESYCIEHNLAHRSRHGLNVSEDVAHIYMSFLADEIANKKESDSITDSPFNNKLLLNKTKEEHLKKRINIINEGIKLELPQNIKDIDINKIIKLRENIEFNDLRKVYIDEISNHFADNNYKKGECYLNNKAITGYREEIRNIFKDTFMLATSCVIIGFFGVELTSLVASTAVASPTIANIARESFSANDKGRGIINSIKRINKKRLVKKYIASLNNI